LLKTEHIKGIIKADLAMANKEGRSPNFKIHLAVTVILDLILLYGFPSFEFALVLAVGEMTLILREKTRTTKADAQDAYSDYIQLIVTIFSYPRKWT
jgi:hypothetical protein